ncbi:hybrid sensor histidine kinase/response regulator [Pokkaliibacter plantistimulans]|uniref:Sensory/regulatory protein RpfC n=1 Tax=Proteobacteria bacterium 228 TaxID=2083153 RepID=A0A2S5KY87_9PROT|nr:CHASE domain-containing protein [Pokkaliibacter plantistimulans]PPC79236.1 hybrid sensor histidine kinase/response regulator [Pokkaliibacter plantistimulans]
MKLILNAVAKDKWALGTLILGVVISFALALRLDSSNHQQIERFTQHEVRELADTVLGRIRLYQYGLRAVRGLVMASGERGISREKFSDYNMTRDITQEFPDARGFGFIRKVSAEELPDFLRLAKNDGWPTFSIRQFAPHDGDLFVIQYIEPVNTNREAIGLDIASEHNRREAAEAAMESGQVRLSAPITLVQASGAPLQSFLIMLPIYQTAHLPDTLEQRREQLIGWSYAPLIMSEIAYDHRYISSGVNVVISDITDTQPAIFFKIDSDLSNPLHLQIDDETIFGRTLRFEVSVTPEYVAGLDQYSPVALALVGGGISLFIALLVGLAHVSYRGRMQLLEEQSKLASIAEASADGIIGKTLEGVVTSWNCGAERLFGYTREEAIGRSILELVVPDYLVHEEAEILASISDGEPVPYKESVRRRKDGSLVHVAVAVSPVVNAGKVVGASKAVRDISRQKSIEEEIRRLNTSLEQQVAERTADLDRLNLLFSNVLTAASEFSVIATDTDGIVTLFNRGAELMLGYQADEVVGLVSPAIFHDEQEMQARKAELEAEYGVPLRPIQVFTYCSEIGRSETREWSYIRKDGVRLPVSLVVTSMRNNQGEIIGYLGIGIDVTRQKQQQADLLSAKMQILKTSEQLLLASHVAELGIWSWDIDTDRLEWNDKMYQLYEYPVDLRQQGLTYAHWESRLNPDDRLEVATSLRQASQTGEHFQATFRLQLPTGISRYLQAVAYAERDYTGKIFRITGINRDVTSEQELESSLRFAKEQADAASAAKSMFLANMSHEIRTPMNAVLGMLQLLKQSELNTSQRDFADKAQIAAKSLLSLLNDILDYSKIDAGKLVLDVHTFSLSELINDLVVILSANLGGKNIELLFDVDTALPDRLLGDRLRLQQVLINLASNAIKFTERGQVVVSVSQYQQAADRVGLRFSVQDSGIGISTEQQQRIFEGFSQAEASTTRRYGGTGLGLAISRQLVTLMGGDLQLSSQPEQGSRFWFDLTLPSAPATQRPQTCRLPSGYRVLVVDDNQAAREIMARTLQGLGAEVIVAESGAEALRLIRQFDLTEKGIELVVLDWRMPEMNGEELAQRIKTDSTLITVPLIMMVTAFGREELVSSYRAGQALFDALLTKPVLTQQLTDEIDALLSTGKGRQEQSVIPEQSRHELQGMKLLLVEDNEFNQLVARELLGREGAEVEVVAGGLAGVERVVTGTQRYDAVLMDMQMPDIDGLEATRRIRNDSRFRDLPIIAMTANVSQADQQACRQAGMTAHLGKPLDMEQVIATLLTCTGRSATAAPSQSAVFNSTEQPTDRSHVVSRFGGNMTLYRSLLGAFEDDLSLQLGSLREAVNNQQEAEVRAILHTLRGTASTVGLAEVSSRIAAVERLARGNVEGQPFVTLADELEQLAHREQAAIKQWLAEQFPAEAPSAGPEQTTDLSSVTALIHQIRDGLEAGDLQALDLTAELCQRLAGQPYEAPLGVLRSLVESMQFEEAQHLLSSLEVTFTRTGEQ